MKEYPSIEGPSKAPRLPCIAFFKYDGSNLRFEWSRKRGFHKFGTRRRLFDTTDPHYGSAIEIFENKYSADLTQIFTKNKLFRGIDRVTAFCEFLGPNSFAGVHDQNDQMDVILFDLYLQKANNFLPPRDFLNAFGHLDIAEVVYEGNFNKQFIEDIMAGKYVGENEGIVAKGVINGKRKSGGLWRAKVKTKWWLEELKKRATDSAEFRKLFQDNLKEQEI